MSGERRPNVIFLVATLLLAAIVPFQASAAIVTFAGLRTPLPAQGTIGHAFVDRTATDWATEYANVGVQGPYTRLVSPDAFDFTTGAELPIGSNLPAHPFGQTASAPHGLEPLGYSGDLHMGASGLVLNSAPGSTDLIFVTPTDEHRIYRGGVVELFEETAPGTFASIALYTNAIFDMAIDYDIGAISGTVTATRSAGTPSFFPETWTFTAFDPVDVEGTTNDGSGEEPYGRFASTSTLTVVPVPEPFVLLGSALFAVAGFRRKSRVTGKRFNGP